MRSWLPGAVDGGEQVGYVPGHWDEFTFFSLENYGKPGKVSYDFFVSFSKQIFFKRLFYMIYMLTPGLCWVEYF